MSDQHGSKCEDAIIIYGNVKLDEIFEALSTALPGRNLRKLGENYSASDEKASFNEIVVKKVDFSYHTIESVEAALVAKHRENELLKHAHEKSVASIQSLSKQQKALYDEFVLLRQKYDQQKASLINILWTHSCAYHPDLRQIPHQISDSENFIETDEQVGDYIIKEALGEGQFAMVKSCVKEGNDKEYALKIIQKERITSFASLVRVSTEIDNLKLLKQNQYIIKITDIIQTQTKLYIVTEKGGYDLFEFFDAHPDGVSEHWAKQIIGCIMKATMYCHDQGICHRGSPLMRPLS